MAESLIFDDDPRSRASAVHVLARRRVRGVVAPTIEAARRALEQRGRWSGFLLRVSSGREGEIAVLLRTIETDPEHRRAPRIVQARIENRSLVRFAIEAHASRIDDAIARATVARLAEEAGLTPAMLEALATYVRLRPNVEGEMMVALASALDVTENTVKTNLRALLEKLRAVGAPPTMAAIDRWIRRGAPPCARRDDALTRNG